MRLVTVLRLAVKHFYGIRSEKLVVEFGIQPFRGRPAGEPEAPPTEEAPTTPGE